MVDGWFSTGDIGVVDDRGLLYLRGRQREEINKGGMKIFPADVDAVIERHTGVLDVCTFAFEHPLYGEDMGVAVVLQRDDGASLGALHAWAASELALTGSRHAGTCSTRSRAPVAARSTAKASRKAVRSGSRSLPAFWSVVMRAGRPLTRRPVANMTSRSALRQRLMRFLIDSGRVTQEDLDANSPLITSELIDSVTLFELALWIEEEIGRPLDLTQLALPGGWDTVDRIITFIEQKQDGQRAR